MHKRNWLLALTAALLCAFVLINWSAVTQSMPLSFLVVTLNAPLGIVLLSICGAMIAVLVGFTLSAQLAAFGDSRRQAAELRAQRELADKAEQSRFSALQITMEREFAELRQQLVDTESRLRDESKESSNSLAACIGEIDDRLERQSPTPQTQLP
ncbi:MAG: hypothetical protein ABI771_13580 [Betaproteobacteria bacterium]